MQKWLWLKRYWLYSLVWLAGLWLLWLVTPIRPIAASTVYPHELFIGFIDEGKSFITLNKIIKKGDVEKNINHGPILVRNTETGVIEQSWFTTEDRFVNVLLWNQHGKLFLLRKQGKADGWFNYSLEWLNPRTGKSIGPFYRLSPDDMPEDHTKITNADLSPDERYVVFGRPFRDGYADVCVEVPTGREVFLKYPGSGGYYFTPDSRHLLLSYRRDGLFVVNLESRKESVIRGPQAKWPPNFSIGWLSPDGSRLFTNSGEVWNIQADKLQAQLSTEKEIPVNSRGPWWSHDGRFICSGGGEIWDEGTGQLLSAVKPDLKYGGHFSADNKEFISPIIFEDGLSLVRHEVHSGQEVTQKRLLVFPSVKSTSQFAASSVDGRLFFVNGYKLDWHPSTLSDRIQEMILKAKAYLKGKTYIPEQTAQFALVDAQRNAVIMKGDGVIRTLVPNGQYMFVEHRDDKGHFLYECWDVPPRKALSAFLYVAAAWLLGCALIRTAFHFLSLWQRSYCPAPGFQSTSPSPS